ncbi:hypothetical protein P8605_06835 [Streptomyces sp. T-3]|nr:hypothetical protein [Streptomyces sp. T-3]
MTIISLIPTTGTLVISSGGVGVVRFHHRSVVDVAVAHRLVARSGDDRLPAGLFAVPGQALGEMLHRVVRIMQLGLADVGVDLDQRFPYVVDVAGVRECRLGFGHGAL